MKNRIVNSILCILIFGLIISLNSGCTRSLKIAKEYRLTDYQTDLITFDTWSYGEWVSSKKMMLLTHSYEPPYKLLLAIRPTDKNWQEIEMLKATISHNGETLDAIPTLIETIAVIEQRPAAAIKEPYAVFHFDNAVEFNEDLILDIEFVETKNRNNVYRQLLHVPYSENKKKGWAFIDNMMSI